MSLTELSCKSAKFLEKPYKLYDTKGLYLFIDHRGYKYWRFKYRFARKEKHIQFGVYPEMSLSEARDKRDESRKLVKSGIDPRIEKINNENALLVAQENGFEIIAREWHTKNLHTWSAGHGKTILARLENNIFPWIGKLPIKDIDAQMLLSLLQRVEERGSVETAHRILQILNCIFRYAIITRKATYNPAADLKGALMPVVHGHYAAITDPKEVAKLMFSIQGYKGDFITRCALRLAPLVFVRPGNLRRAEWDELDLENATWKISAEKMKLPFPLITHLSRQSLAIFKEIKPVTGKFKYVFPSALSKDRPMSDNTILAALRRMGYTSDQMTGHGFRTMASTMLNEQGWKSDAIERQLAHLDPNTVRASYNYAEYLEERREMMQTWADYLDKLVADFKDSLSPEQDSKNPIK